LRSAERRIDKFIPFVARPGFPRILTILGFH
jgi:hypothetical protein